MSTVLMLFRYSLPLNSSPSCVSYAVMVILLFALSFNAHCPFLSWLSRCRPVYLRLATSYKFSAFFNSAILCMIFLAESRPYSLMSALSVFMIFSILLFFASTFIDRAIIKACLKKASLFCKDFLKHQKNTTSAVCHLLAAGQNHPFPAASCYDERVSTLPPRVGHGAALPDAHEVPGIAEGLCVIKSVHQRSTFSQSCILTGVARKSVIPPASTAPFLPELPARGGSPSLRPLGTGALPNRGLFPRPGPVHKNEPGCTWPSRHPARRPC